MTDDFASWRSALDGGKPPIHEGEPWCGYFKMRDRRGLNIDLAPIKRPWIPAAIWRGTDGELVGELAGVRTPVGHLWPYIAKHPIPYEDYVFFHTHERWPEAAAA